MNLFQVVPENFFSILTSKNKRIYVSLIIEAFKVYETGSILGIDKKIVVDELVHYLDSNTFTYSQEDETDEEANPNSNRELANYALRKMEECGWIYIDVTNDYIEILNFSDAGITMCEAISQLAPAFYYDDEEFAYNKTEYQGYIYTIYSLLTNSDNIEYSVIMQEVYRNTKLLLRSIRRLDSRLKDYINSVFENTDVKDLMENLVQYRQDFVEKGYAKLKMSDNINRYRLRIVTKLEEYQNSNEIMDVLTLNYPKLEHEAALNRANRDIDEIIDVFNALDDFITEIDEKNRNYINSTISKIKFLLSEDDNIIGKLNRVLKYIRDEHKKQHLDKAMRLINGGINLTSTKRIDENSLYVPRGAYKRNFNLLIDDSRLDGFDIESDFIAAYKAPYQENDIKVFLNDYMVDGKLYGSDVIKTETDLALAMLAIYAILYALENENNYEVLITNNRIHNRYLRMRDFIIRKRDE